MAFDEGPAPRAASGMTRKLAAILSADVVGYSRLMGEDEEATIHILTVYREVIAALVQQHRGRVVDSPGDNLLAEFASVMDAVQCAVAIQRELNARNTALPLQRRMQFRLGINLGDVIPEGERIYGDGVNIAARLESLADAGGICISGTVYDQIATKLAFGYEFVGERMVKNITRPVRVYRLQTESGSPGLKVRLRNRLGAGSWPRMALVLVALLFLVGGVASSWRFFPPSLPISVIPSQKTGILALPDKPSIAVLPFVNMSEESTQEYFSDGMTEDLITDLARLKGLFVIARNSVFTYKGKAVKPEQVSRELGVRYMLEGSVRKANDRVRITAQLIDATTGYHLWAERYDRKLQDIFAVQEDIARRITRALAIRLTPQEEQQMAQNYTDNPEALDLFMRATKLYRNLTQEANAEAQQLLKQAIALDPQFARAYANLAATYRQEWNYEWTPDLAATERRAFEAAQRSVELDPSLPYGHVQLAYLYVYRLQHHDAIREAEEAVHLGGANYADGRAVLAQVLIYAGQPERAIPLMEEALNLDRKAPVYYFNHLGHAYYVMGQYEKYRRGDGPKAMAHYQKAEEYLTRALTMNPNHRASRTHLVAVYMESGRETEARAIFAQSPDMLRLINISQRRMQGPHIDLEMQRRYITALRTAGSLVSGETP